MSPAFLSGHGIIAAVTKMTEDINNSNLMRASLKTNLDIRLSSKMEIHLYRVISEIVHNAIKHARASKLTLQIIKTDRSIIISVQDNGKGFDIEKRKTDSGLGLKNITNRIKLMKGSLALKSDPEQGTSYRIEIPYEEQDY